MKAISITILTAAIVFGASAQAEEAKPAAAAPAMGGMQHGQGMQGMQQGAGKGGMEGMGNMQEMHKNMQQMQNGMNMDGKGMPDCPNGADCPATKEMQGQGGAAPAK
jgi:hypothetical protein